jgi:tetratricopeptide (TPR) repeat protein
LLRRAELLRVLGRTDEARAALDEAEQIIGPSNARLLRARDHVGWAGRYPASIIPEHRRDAVIEHLERLLTLRRAAEAGALFKTLKAFDHDGTLSQWDARQKLIEAALLIADDPARSSMVTQQAVRDYLGLGDEVAVRELRKTEPTDADLSLPELRIVLRQEDIPPNDPLMPGDPELLGGLLESRFPIAPRSPTVRLEATKAVHALPWEVAVLTPARRELTEFQPIVYRCHCQIFAAQQPARWFQIALSHLTG